ncbi:MAG: extracellular solute-binding protein, partial [Bacilli bacterium]
MKPRKTIFGITALLVVAGLTGCVRPPIPSGNDSQGDSVTPGQKTKIDFWTGFGGAVNGVLEPLIARFEEKNPDIDVIYESKGGYPNLKQAISQSVSNNAFPHIANGYPDHFADYANSNIMLNLDTKDFIQNTDPNVGV